jgi:O-antigen biosynthesis protein
LGGKKVVRYLLNKPGAFNGVQIGDYGAQDYIIHFSDEFRHEQLASHPLPIPLVDLTLFNRTSETQARHGYLLYSVRHKPALDEIPEWVSPRVVISQENPRDPATLARLYRQSKALAVWEPTAAISEAMHCGCPVMMIPRAGFNHWAIVRKCRGGGLVVGWDEAGLAVAQGTVGIVKGLYHVRSLDLDLAIHEFVWQACRYFDSPVNRAQADHGGWAVSHFLRKLAAWQTFQSSRR